MLLVVLRSLIHPAKNDAHASTLYQLNHIHPIYYKNREHFKQIIFERNIHRQT